VKLKDVYKKILNGCWGKDPGSSDLDCYAIKVSDINSDGTVSYADATRRSVSQTEYEQNALMDSDVLVVKSSGSSSRVVSGKCAPFRNPDGRRYVPVNFLLTIRADKSMILPELLYHFLSSQQARNYVLGIVAGATYPNLKKDHYLDFEIPLPPLDEQERIVTDLEGYRKVIEGGRLVLSSYKSIIRIDPAWPQTELGSMATFKNGINYSKANKGKGIKVIGVADFHDHLIAPIEGLNEINPKGVVTDKDLLQDGDILFVRSNGNKALVGRSLLITKANERVTHSGFTIRLRFGFNKALPMFYAFLFKDPAYRVQLMGRGANINNLSQDILGNIVVPVPALEIQHQIVAELVAERKLVEANRDLIARMEAKIKAKLAEIWGETKD
jgi:restriction endonuclease S subunit